MKQNQTVRSVTQRYQIPKLWKTAKLNFYWSRRSVWQVKSVQLCISVLGIHINNIVATTTFCKTTYCTIVHQTTIHSTTTSFKDMSPVTSDWKPSASKLIILKFKPYIFRSRIKHETMCYTAEHNGQLSNSSLWIWRFACAVYLNIIQPMYYFIKITSF